MTNWNLNNMLKDGKISAPQKQLAYMNGVEHLCIFINTYIGVWSVWKSSLPRSRFVPSRNAPPQQTAAHIRAKFLSNNYYCFICEPTKMTNHLSVNWTQRMSHCDFRLHLRCQLWRARFCFAFIKTESKTEGFYRQKLKNTFGPKMGDFKLYNTWHKSWISKFSIEENYFLARNSYIVIRLSALAIMWCHKFKFKFKFIYSHLFNCNTTHLQYVTCRCRPDKVR